MLRLSNLSLRRGARELFGDVTLTIHPGQKVGLTGANGVGKSSLFALILGELQSDTGDLFLPAGTVIAHVAQETPAVDRPAIEYVLDGDTGLRRIQAAIRQAEDSGDGEGLGRLHAELDAVGGYDAHSRAGRLMAGLGFPAVHQQRPVRSFSGGWRMRLNLAQALMCRSDLLLLDEPTNHLDLEAVLWLEEWLAAYPGTLLLISHDREFLDRVVTHIAHMESASITLCTGNYSAFERWRAQQLATQQSAYERQQREIAHIRAFVDRFRAKATKARQAQSRLKALERMEEIGPAHVDSPFHFRFEAPERMPNPVLSLKEAGAGYGDTPVLAGIRLSIAPGDRLGLLGHNGAGKSTLIKLLAGTMEPRDGERLPARGLMVGYFAQHQLEQLEDRASPLEHLQRQDRHASEQQLRDYLGGFGFAGDRAEAQVAPFSGGEKARLVLALIVRARPNLLLLDEPTNHLDLDMRLALSTALQDFQGAMVVVSHDRHLLRTVTDRFLLVADGRVEPFDGDLEDYRARVREERQRSTTAGSGGGAPGVAGRSRRQAAAEKRRRQQPLRNRVVRLEKKMEALAAESTVLEQRLSDTDLYQAGRQAELTDLLKQRAELDRRLQVVESEWLTASEALEDS